MRRARAFRNGQSLSARCRFVLRAAIVLGIIAAATVPSPALGLDVKSCFRVAAPSDLCVGVCVIGHCVGFNTGPQSLGICVAACAGATFVGGPLGVPIPESVGLEGGSIKIPPSLPLCLLSCF